MSPKTCLALDNGSYACKYALFPCRSGKEITSLQTVPNFVAKPKTENRRYYGQDIVTHCHDYTSLQVISPFEKGLLTNWQLQVELWERLFAQIKCDTTDTALLLTEPMFNLPNIQYAYDQIVFEYFDFPFFRRMTAPDMVADVYAAETPGGCHVVVDVGHAFTHVVPYFEHRPILSASYRIDVGGDFLTQQLKQAVSFRQYNMMDETFIINDVKETCCYVSNDFEADMKRCKSRRSNNGITQRYVLPDYSRRLGGRIKADDEPTQEDEQILMMGNERLRIPELLFRPSDAAVNQAGIAETVAMAIRQVCGQEDITQGNMDRQSTIERLLYGNIRIIGGSSLFSGFQERLQSELRALAPSSVPVEVCMAEDPIKEATACGAKLLQQAETMSDLLISRSQWQEEGPDRHRW